MGRRRLLRDVSLFGDEDLVNDLLDVALDKFVHGAARPDFAHLRVIGVEFESGFPIAGEAQDGRLFVHNQLPSLVLGHQQGEDAYMADGRRACASNQHLLTLHETHDPIVLQLVTETAGHLPREKRIVLETIQQLVTCMSFRYETSDLGSNLAHFNPFGATMGSPKEDEPAGGQSDSRILGILMRIEQSLSRQSHSFQLKS